MQHHRTYYLADCSGFRRHRNSGREGLPRSDATSDWFELTNLGDVAATGLDGKLFYDDNSDDPTAAVAILGLRRDRRMRLFRNDR
jgi:hypothetical protein